MKIYAAADIAHNSDQVATRQIMHCSAKVARAWFIGGWQLSVDESSRGQDYAAAVATVRQEWQRWWSPDKTALAKATAVLWSTLTNRGDTIADPVNIPNWWTLGTAMLLIGEDPNYPFDNVAQGLQPLIEKAVARAVAAECEMIVIDNEEPGFFQNINFGMEYQRRTIRRHRWQNQHVRTLCQRLPVSNWMALCGLTGNASNPSDPAEIEFVAESDKARQFNDFAVSPIYGSMDEVKAEHDRMAARCRKLSIDFVPSIQVDDGVSAAWMAERLAFFSPRVSRCILWAPGTTPLASDVLAVVRKYAK